jgi:hypothetical protein
MRPIATGSDARAGHVAVVTSGAMRVEGSVTTVSWIPSQAVAGSTRIGFKVGLAHYDDAPPAELGANVVGTLDRLSAAGRFRFANHLWAFAEFDGAGEVVRYGQLGSGHVGRAALHVAGVELTLAGAALPELRAEPEVGDDWVRFRQTWGGRASPLSLRRSRVAWTTVELTLRADGRRYGRLAGASAFPRHWVYDSDGTLTHKTSTTDWKGWSATPAGAATPWGDTDSATFVSAVESELERELSVLMMSGRPDIRRLRAGDVLVRQGDPGHELLLLLDGVLVVEIDGEAVAEVGPGAVVGERAILEQGRRTATLTARTACRVAAVPGDLVARDRLAELAAGRRQFEPR